MSRKLRFKRATMSLAIILLFTFTFSFIGAPFQMAYAMEATAAAKIVDQVQPVSNTLNQPKSYGDVIIAGPSDMPAKPGKERIEIPSRRSANSKMFLEPDGTFSVDVYPHSVFYKNNKLKWVPIESDIVPANNGAFNSRSKANRFNVSFAPNSKVRYQQKDFFIDIEPAGAKPAQGVTSGKKIKYSSVYQNVDIEYTSDNDMLKEEIILNSPDSPGTYTFDVNTSNLTIKKDAKTGDLTLYDKNGNAIAYFMPPVMVDANKVTSDKVTLEYIQANGKEQLVVTADPEWLKDPEREFPVKVDPTIFPGDVSKDTFVSDWYPSSQMSAYSYLSSGYSNYNGKTRAFIQYTLPSLPSSSIVTSGSFSLYQYLSNTAAIVDVHKITSTWAASSTTWNYQPMYSATAETGASVSTTGYITFLISNLVKGWYNATTSNYGVAVKHRNENEAVKEFISSNNTTNPNTPYMTINYTVDPLGQEDQWGFTPEGVNGFNGNLLQQVTDLSIPGRGIPVSFTRTYNSRSAKDGVFGYGWAANVGISIKDSGYGPVILTDEDGTEHIFSRQFDNTFVAPNGVFLELVKDYTNNTYTLTNNSGIKTEFNTNGQVTKISDVNKTPNATSFSYTSGKLSSITDASGRVTNFYYNASSKLSKITDPASSRDILYGYDSNGNLTTVTDPEGKVTTYGYDAGRNLTSITDPNGKTVSFGYDTANDRVTSISKTITVNGTPSVSTTTVGYDIPTNTTTRTDARNNITKYVYDGESKIKEIVQDPGGLNYSTKFSYDVDNDVSQITDPKSGTYTASYELGKGNIIDETNPLSEKYQYSYDSRNNQTQQIDPENRVENYTYDKSNNTTDIIDAFTQTSADRYLGNGNVDYETTPMSAAENLVTNSSAERDANLDSWPDEWSKYFSGTTSFAWSTTSKFGGRSMEIGSTSSWATVMNTRAVLYDSTKSYVLSGYVQTQNLSAKAAYIKADFYDSAGNWIGETRSPSLGGDTDWTRMQLILDQSNIPSGTYKFYASVGRGTATGLSRYDSLQIEVGTVLSAYNMVENASLELDADGNKIPDQWGTNFALGVGEGRDTAFKHAGGASFKITGQSGVNKYITQNIKVKGDQNSKLTLSGWSYADNPDLSGGNYALQVKINHTDGTTDWSYANNFTKENHADTGWEHVVAEIKPTKAFSSIDVYYYFYNQRGGAWFDAMRLQEGNNISKYGYDTNGNYVTSVTDPLSNKTDFEYDTKGNRTKVTDPKSNATSYLYDQLNRMSRVTDVQRGITQYGYDDNGNRITVTDARNKVTTYGYNEINQVKSITDPLNKTVNIDHDLVGNQTAISYPNGSSVGFGYDKLDRPTSILFNGLSRYTFGYDSKGNLTSMEDVGKSETTGYAYDADDKLSQVTYPGGSLITYHYDKTGNLRSLARTIGVNNYATNYTYDALENTYKVTGYSNGRTNSAYNENGSLAGAENGNGSKSFYQYDDAGRLKNLRLFKANSGNLGNYSYTYDASSNITGVSLTSDSLGSKAVSYTYDALNRLTSETLRDGTLIEYTYDAVGNRLTKKVTLGGSATTTDYSYDNANQMTAVNGTTYTYDFNGNMTGNGSQNFEYDADNRLVRVTTVSDGSLVASFEYDGLGRRTAKITPAGTTKYYYDGDSNRVFYETDGSGSLLAQYTYGQDGQLLWMVRGSQIYYYHYNGHGDVVALTDSSGAIVAEYDYDAWGNPVATGLEVSVVNPYRYAGYRWDAETGMYYLNARYYKADIGRFITRDTFDGFESKPQSLNRYIYAESNPVKYTDAEGRFAIFAPAIPYLYYLLTIGALALLAEMMLNDNDKPWYSLPGSMKQGKYPSEYRDSTWKKIKDDARKGITKARTAKKIIEQGAKRIVEKVKSSGGNKGGKKK